MASATTVSSPQRISWLRRWLSRPSKAESPTVKTATVSAPPPVSHSCDLCGFTSRLRGTVYDHIKSTHKEVFDRNGHICEQDQDAPPPSH